jgi:O-antigen/teichoic acid export membrane protein
LENSFTAKYLKIYLWQGISLILNFASMFIVVPYLTKEPSIYGIYTVCISISIFLVYADLGFVSAGQKYVAECYARGETDEEVRIMGFISFILLLFLLVVMGVFFYFSLNPQSLLKGLQTPSNIKIASKLILILASFAPFIILQRVSQIIFGVRLEDYLSQRILVVGNLIKIISVLYFFKAENYQIVSYFLFCQIVNAISYIVCLLIARKKYKYNFFLLFQALRFNKSIYKKVNKLAFTSLFLIISWILYYEIDNIIIGKYLGVEKVAIYAVGFTLLSFFRTIYGILFSPLVIRFNHFIGLGNIEGLKIYITQVIVLTAPAVMIPVTAIVIICKPFMLSWVGAKYYNSIEIAQILIFCNFCAFISQPVSSLLVAQEKIKTMYIIGSIIPIIYWLGIIITYRYLGLKSFAIFTFIAINISVIYYLNYLMKFLNISFNYFFKEVIIPILIPLAFLCIFLFAIYGSLPVEKSTGNLVFVIFIAGIGIAMAFVIQYMTSLKIRKMAKAIISTIGSSNLK